MTVPRFHVPFALEDLVQVELPEEAAHHAARVLRLRPGDLLCLFDGLGGEWQASMHAVERDRVIVDVGRHIAVERESPLAIRLAQGLSSGDRMDFTLQKAVQLGVTRFQPLETRKSVVRLTESRGERRQQHWKNIVVRACEQCGRNRLPEVLPVAAIGDWLDGLGEAREPRLLLDPDAPTRLRDLPAPRQEITLLVGPEAGLSDDEHRLAVGGGFVPVRLGPRTLRTETAGAAVIAAMQALWGDF